MLVRPRSLLAAGSVVGVIVGLLAPRAAHAVDPPVPAPTQDPPSSEPSKLIAAEPLEVTVKADPGAPDTFTSSRAASSVTEGEIRAASPGSLADALRGRGGASVQQTSPGQGTVYVRGLSGREIMHLVDGVPLNAAIFRAGNNPYLGLVDPYSFVEIDVIRGASSVLHGSDALGGVVSMITALPGYAVGDGVTTARVFQGFSVGPLGTASRIAVEHKAGRWTGHLGLTYHQSGDIRPGGGEPSPLPDAYWGLERQPDAAYQPVTSSVQHGTAFQMYAGNGALRRRLSDRTEIVLRGQFGFRPELVRHDEITPRFKNDAPRRAESSLQPFYRTMTSATLAYRPAGSPLTEGILQVAWQRIHEDVERRNLSERCIDPAMETPEDEPCAGLLRLVPSDTVDWEANRSDALSAKGEVRLADAARTRGLRLGVDAVHDIVTSSAGSINRNTLAEEPGTARYPSGSSMTQAGIYAQGEAELLWGIRAHLGVRGAFFHLDIKERIGDAASAPALQSSLFDVAVNAGVRWELTPGVSWVVNGGRGVRSPNVQDFAALGARANGRFQLPNADIRPEHTISADTGIKVLVGKTMAETYVFYLHYMDAIALAPATLDGSETNAAGERYERSENAARVVYYGSESMLGVPFASFLGVEAHAILMIGTQHNEGRLGLPLETPADRVSPPTGRLVLWVEPVPTVRVEGVVFARLAQRRLNDPVNLEDNRIPEGGTPGFVTLGLRGTWHARPDITARLAVDNLTDALVLEHGSGFYRPGVNAAASVDLTF